jgi:hypothetical protein
MENLSSQIIDQGPGVAPCPCGVDDDLALTQTTSPNLPEPGSKSVPDSRYCFSYTPFLLTLWPFASVPLMVTVRLLPSPDTTIRPLVISLPPFMTLKPQYTVVDFGAATAATAWSICSASLPTQLLT